MLTLEVTDVVKKLSTISMSVPGVMVLRSGAELWERQPPRQRSTIAQRRPIDNGKILEKDMETLLLKSVL